MSSEPTPPAPSEGLPQGSATDMQNILLGSVSGTRPATQPGQPWVPPTPEELQKLLPQYEIHAMLGRGGMGAVYQARQVSLDRMAAIKILSNDLENMDASFSERFKNEARAMARLSHPGIIAVYDFGQTETGLLYIVMEFVEGTDVHQMISASGRLHTEHAMAITAHVCDALHYAHERGIIHRDIKPANIMVGYDGSVKVADFGLAKVNVGGETLGLTQSGMAMGTPHYIAPEALILGSQTDRRADIYAMGVMLYHMLTGKLPQGLFELPSIQVPGLDPRYDGIIARAMREDRDLRYATAADMRADLDSILTQPVPKTEPEQSSNNAPSATLPHAARPQRPGAGRPHRPSPRPQPQVIMHTERKSSPLPWLAMLATGGVAAWLFLVPEKRQEAAPSAKKVTEPTAKASISAAAPVPPPAKAEPAPSPAQAAVAASPTPAMTEPAPPISMTAPKLTPQPEVLPPASPLPKDSDAAWQPLFPNDSLEGWKDVGEGHSLTNGVLTCTASGRDLISPGQYGNFHLKFDVKLGPGANNGIGIWRELLPDSTALDEGSGFEVQLLDDTAPEFARVSTWQKHGGIYFFKEPASSPMNAPGTWNAHEIRVEGTKVTVIINNVTVLDADLTTLRPLVTRRGPLRLDKKRGHLVFMGNKGPVEFRNVMIKDLNASAASISGSSAAPTTGVVTFNGHRYQFVPGALTWIEAKAKAESMGGHLATITSKEENDFLLQAFKFQLSPAATTLKARMIWLGGIEDKPGAGWKWVTGEPFTFTAWMPGEPNGKEGGRGQIGHPFMLNFYSSETLHGWNDNSADPVLASKMLGFIVEWDSASPENTTPASIGSAPTWTDTQGRTLTAKFLRIEGANAVLEINGKPTPVSLAQLSPESRQIALQLQGGAQSPPDTGHEWLVGRWHQTNDANTAEVFTVLCLTDNKAIFEAAGRQLEGTWEIRDGQIFFQWSNGYSYEMRMPGSADSKVMLGQGFATDRPGSRPFEIRMAKVGEIAMTAAPPELTKISKDQPFVNSLGMKFVPVPGTRVLMCIHETRRADFARYAEEAGNVNSMWQDLIPEAAESQQEDHPVANVTWSMAASFCTWLSTKEGRTYRLPSDREWSHAVGIGEEEARLNFSSPSDYQDCVPGVFPWGKDFPPRNSRLAGNLADTSWQAAFRKKDVIPGYKDGFAITSPVMSFQPNKLGIYDLSGNVREWTRDLWASDGSQYVLRGGCWLDNFAGAHLSSRRWPHRGTNTNHGCGFRVVLELPGN